MKSALLIFFFSFFLFSCAVKSKKETPVAKPDKMVLMEADRKFSSLCEEKGMKNAFLEYIDSNGLLLRPNEIPVIGANAIDYLVRQNDSEFKLSWKPKDGVIAESGELGFTYGYYAMQPKNRDTVFYGTYVNVWKKQHDGSWKYILNSGNDGIGDK